MIFDCNERSDGSPSTYSESAYDFFNRHKSAAASRVRNELERWALSYPAESRNELYRRFEVEFEATFFELFLHELFSCQGGKPRIHPDSGNRGKRPDFEIAHPEFPEAILLEAAVYFDEATEFWSPRLKLVFDKINGIDSPDFFVLIKDAVAKSTENPRASRIVSFLTKRLRRLDGDFLLKSAEQGEPLVEFSYEDALVMLTFQIVPRRRCARGRSGSQNIGVLPVVSRWGNSVQAIRTSLETKSKKYGSLNKPFVIALNSVGDWPQDEQERVESLFGSRQHVVDAFGEIRTVSIRDGFWGCASEPKHTRVSAVVLGRVCPVSLSNATLCLYHNPWAAYPIPLGLWQLTSAMLKDGKVEYQNSDNRPGDVLGLSSEWPGPLFDS